MIRVHHLNCATLHPTGGALVLPQGADALVCHVLLLETDSSLVLVDSGFGTLDVQQAKQRLGRRFVHVVRPDLLESETAIAQVRRLGFDPKDVRHVILTHLDLDHAGGVADFPHAAVHVLAAEHRAAMARRSLRERSRYRPAQWQHGPRWETYEPVGESFEGFQAVRSLRGLPPEILMVPLAGHTHGHSAVAVRTEAIWRFHAGDAYFAGGELSSPPECPPMLSVFERIVAMDDALRLANLARLRELSKRHDVVVFSAHDQLELKRLQLMA